ncbi:MAG: hypothetical protein ACREDC_05705 [Bradyrhizobium sp.]
MSTLFSLESIEVATVAWWIRGERDRVAAAVALGIYSERDARAELRGLTYLKMRAAAGRGGKWRVSPRAVADRELDDGIDAWEAASAVVLKAAWQRCPGQEILRVARAALDRSRVGCTDESLTIVCQALARSTLRARHGRR